MTCLTQSWTVSLGLPGAMTRIHSGSSRRMIGCFYILVPISAARFCLDGV